VAGILVEDSGLKGVSEQPLKRSRSTVMHKTSLAVALVAVMALVPAYGQDKAKEWCTDAHMEQMAAELRKITDANKKEAARKHLEMSKAAMQANNMKGCVKHMEEAHQAMGL
jgi:hypothetical protein